MLKSAKLTHSIMAFAPVYVPAGIVDGTIETANVGRPRLGTAAA